MWEPTGPVEVIAHRGASAQAPEHTIAAYDLALDQGADTLELDVRATADGELVVVHDRTLWRTALDKRRVARLTCADLAELDPAVRPLTLDAVLARYGGRARLLVELKDPLPPWESDVVEALRRHGVLDSAVVQSFDRPALRRLREAEPALRVALLTRVAPLTTRRMRALAAWAEGIGVWHGAVDAEVVLRARAAGLTLRAWTANEPDEVDRLLRAGVDGVITDVPGTVRQQVDAAAALAA